MHQCHVEKTTYFMSDTHKVMTADWLPSKYYFRVFSATSQICLLMIYECGRDLLSCAHCIFVIFRSFLFCGFFLSSCLTLVSCHHLTFSFERLKLQFGCSWYLSLWYPGHCCFGVYGTWSFAFHHPCGIFTLHKLYCLPSFWSLIGMFWWAYLHIWGVLWWLCHCL